MNVRFWRFVDNPFVIQRCISIWFKIYHSKMRHFMMIRAQANHIAKFISSSLRSWSDMVYIDKEIKPANNATIAVAFYNLIAFPARTTPLPSWRFVVVYLLSMSMILAYSTTVYVFPIGYFAFPALKFFSAKSALHNFFIFTSSARYQALPFEIALFFSACNLNLAGITFKCFSANWTGALFFSAPIIPIVLAFVLMGIYKSPLLAGVLSFFQWVPASASAKDDFIRFFFCFHKTIIPHKYSYGK